jgi:hypothetical protein
MARLSDVPIGPLAPILPFPGTSDKLLSLLIERADAFPIKGQRAGRPRLLGGNVSRHSFGALKNVSHRRGKAPGQAKPPMGGRAVSFGVVLGHIRENG